MFVNNSTPDDKKVSGFKIWSKALAFFGAAGYTLYCGISHAMAAVGQTALIDVFLGILGGSVFLYFALCSFDPLFKEEKEEEIDNSVVESSLGRLPHFGKKLDQDKVEDIIGGLKFSPYVTKNGKKLKNLAISEDEKWIRIMGGYLPVDLICGYNARDGLIYAIDGKSISLPYSYKYRDAHSDIEQFFEDRGIWYKTMPNHAENRFLAARDNEETKLDKENFGKVRYLWEKAIANDNSGYSKKDKKAKYRVVSRSEEGGNVFFERVLSNDDIRKTGLAVLSGKIELANYLRFEDYSNEYSVCNCVELLKYINYPKNAEGIDFLFNCLGDVDEAYFTYAVEVLQIYPEKLLQEKIEENVRLAFEKGDVVHLAGVMYLAGDMEYEIEYIKELKKAKESRQAAEGAAVAGVVTGSAGIPEFDFDEALAFGSEEVQRFDVKRA